MLSTFSYVILWNLHSNPVQTLEFLPWNLRSNGKPRLKEMTWAALLDPWAEQRTHRSPAWEDHPWRYAPAFAMGVRKTRASRRPWTWWRGWRLEEGRLLSLQKKKLCRQRNIFKRRKTAVKKGVSPPSVWSEGVLWVDTTVWRWNGLPWEVMCAPSYK